jgi:hypothetical protein
MRLDVSSIIRAFSLLAAARALSFLDRLNPVNQPNAARQFEPFGGANN